MIAEATEYSRKKYGEPVKVIVLKGVKVDGNGLPVFEAGYCPDAHLIVCIKRIGSEEQEVC